jgi:hypothetical protein
MVPLLTLKTKTIMKKAQVIHGWDNGNSDKNIASLYHIR